jgi:hypothetical protein
MPYPRKIFHLQTTNTWYQLEILPFLARFKYPLYIGATDYGEENHLRAINIDIGPSSLT